MPNVSIIIPVYKAEKYLDKCVASVVNQTYKDLEIILVDDGSPDNCPAMCDEWAKKDSRIKVLHKENGGVSSARNIGIECSTGEYITFVDSDDYLDERFCEVMMGHINAHSYDMVACRAMLSQVADEDIYLDFSSNIEQKNYKELVDFWACWSKVYKISIIKDNNLTFDLNTTFGEDTEFVYRYLYWCKNVLLSKEKLYGHTSHEDSAVCRCHKNINENFAKQVCAVSTFFDKLNISNDDKCFLKDYYVFINFPIRTNMFVKFLPLKEGKKQLEEMFALFEENISRMRKTLSKNKTLLTNLTAKKDMIYIEKTSCLYSSKSFANWFIFKHKKELLFKKIKKTLKLILNR